MQWAFDRWQQMRDEFELVRHAQFQRAVAELRGELLNRRGHEAGIDPYSLFMGTTARARAYASEELWEWWQEKDNERRTLESFEMQWMYGQMSEESNHG